MAIITFPEFSVDPSPPSVGHRIIYPKSDGWYQQDSDGLVTKLGDSALADLAEVDISSTPISGQVLTYNIVTGKWERSTRLDGSLKLYMSANLR